MTGLQLGASVVANPILPTDQCLVVATNKDSQKIINIMNAGYDIVTPAYVFQVCVCVRARARANPNP